MNISAGETAAVASSFFAAVAATASWITVLADRKRQHELRKPHVSAILTVDQLNQGRIVFVNAGPGLAIRLGFYGVDTGPSGSRVYQGGVGAGFLPPGAEAEARVGQMTRRSGEAHFIWLAADVDNNLYIWSIDGRYNHVGATDVLSRNVPNAQVLFTRFYPSISPAATAVTA